MKITWKRAICWLCGFAIAFLCIYGESYIDSFISEATISMGMAEKHTIVVSAPSNMEKAFEEALKDSDLNSNTYQIEMTNDSSNASVIVDMNKENDPNYQELAYSPLVIATKFTTSSMDKEFLEKGLTIKSQFDESKYEIDFIKAVDEVIGEGKWENLGLEDDTIKDITIFYPSEKTIYWKTFYDFMLVTINGGKYPETEESMQRAINKINLFLASDFTEAVTDYEVTFSRTNGFSRNAMWIMPEELAIKFSGSNSITLWYPTKTVIFKYYIHYTDELGNQLMPSIETDDFYNTLRKEWYRSKYYNKLKWSGFSIKDGLRNSYNLVEIPQ